MDQAIRQPVRRWLTSRRDGRSNTTAQLAEAFDDVCGLEDLGTRPRCCLNSSGGFCVDLGIGSAADCPHFVDFDLLLVNDPADDSPGVVADDKLLETCGFAGD